MSSNTLYNFPESKLGQNFAQDKMAEFRRLIDGGQSFTVVSMPGVGVSYFLKYLAMQPFAFFVHVDLYLLPTLTRHEFYRLLHREVGGKPRPKTDEQVFIETKEVLNNFAQNNERLVLIFSRFDQLKKELDANFLSNLQSLTTVSPGKIVLILTAIKPLHELAPKAITGGNLTFYSKYLYFKPYSTPDLKKLLEIEGKPLNPKIDLDRQIELSGGHSQLLHILLNSQKEQLLLDQFVRLQLKELLDYLDYQQRKQVEKIALGKNVSQVDDYLLDVGYVTEAKSGHGLFSPLLAEYIKTNLPQKLPLKEAKLFKLLKNNMGRLVTKDEIFKAVWEDKAEEATDWALDALVYRLRNSPFIKAAGYIIESQKKVGYTLIQN